MKHIYKLFLGAALISGSATAATVPDGAVMKQLNLKYGTEGLKRTVNICIPKHQQRNAPAKSAEVTPIIYDAPGVEKLYYRNSEGYDVSFDGYPFINTKGGVAQRMKFDGNDVYMYNPLSTFASTTWIKGEVTDAGLCFPLPQTFRLDYDEEWDWSDYYDVNLFELYHDDEFGDTYIEADGVENQYLLRLMPNGSYQFDTEILDLYDAEYDIEYQLPRYIIAATANWSEDNYFPEWTYYGDFYCNIKEFNGTPVEAPAALNTAEWVAVSEGNGFKFDLGRDGDDIYFKGLFNTVPDLWVKGTVADGKVSIPSRQYAGIDDVNNLFCFFYAGPMDAYFNEEYWSMFFDIESQPFGVLDFNETENRMTTNQGFVLASSDEIITASGYIQKPVIMLQPEDISKVPVNPTILDYVEYGHWGDYAAVEFRTSNLDADGYFIGDDSCFSYRIISDGEPVVFEPGDDYPEIPETMEWIPFNFTDDYSLMNDPYLYGDYRLHIVYYHAESKQYTAIQVRYTDPETGEEFFSTPEVFWGEGVGVAAIEAENAASKEYYNLQGMRINAPVNGMCIERMADGKYRKVVR